MKTVLVVALLAFTSSARADKSDWNQFIDKNPSAPVASKPVDVVPKTKQTATAKKQTPQKSVAKSKAKVHAKAKPTHH